MTRPIEWVEPTPATGTVLACCSDLYTNPLAELLIGDSLHPGGLASTQRLLRDAGLAPGSRLLDAGCGLGASARLAADKFGLVVDAVDGSADAVALAEARSGPGRIRWHRAELSALPFEGGEFDGVLAECVLSTTERATVLAELARVIRPKGVLVMSDVEVEPHAVPALAGHRLLGAALCVTDAWRPGELEASLPAAGFGIEHRLDLTLSILALVDRAEARVGLAAIAARDIGLGLAPLAGSAATPGGTGLDAAQAHDIAESVRAAVREGRLRYVGVLARQNGGTLA